MPKSALEKALHDLIKEAVKEAYYDLQSGEQEVQPADGEPEPQSSSETPKRTRRTKAQIAADEAKEKAPEVTYEQLATAVLEYVTQHGKPAAVAILKKQFGVEKAQALAPEQWGEALALFSGASEEESIA